MAQLLTTTVNGSITVGNSTVNTAITQTSLKVDGAANVQTLQLSGYGAVANSTGYWTGQFKVWVGTTAPSSPAVGDLWVDTN